MSDMEDMVNEAGSGEGGWGEPVFYGTLVLFLIAGMVVGSLMRRPLSEQGLLFWAVTMVCVITAAVLALVFLVPGR